MVLIFGKIVSNTESINKHCFGNQFEIKKSPTLLAPFIGNPINNNRVISTKNILVYFGKFEAAGVQFWVGRSKNSFRVFEGSLIEMRFGTNTRKLKCNRLNVSSVIFFKLRLFPINNRSSFHFTLKL